MFTFVYKLLQQGFLCVYKYIFSLCAIALKHFFSLICAFALTSFQAIALLYQERKNKIINNTLSPYNWVRCQKDRDFTAKLEFHVRLLMCFWIVMDDSYQISGCIFVEMQQYASADIWKAYLFITSKLYCFDF